MDENNPEPRFPSGRALARSLPLVVNRSLRLQHLRRALERRRELPQTLRVPCPLEGLLQPDAVPVLVEGELRLLDAPSDAPALCLLRLA